MNQPLRKRCLRCLELLYWNNECALLWHIFSILNLDWLLHARSVRRVYGWLLKLEVGYRGLFFGHSFRSSWTPDKLVTWYLLIPFSKKKLKKFRKPGCPLRKMEASKMAAAMCQNWHFQPFWHFFEYFSLSLVKTCYFMFLMPRNPFLKDLLIFDFSFLRKGQFC